MSRRFKLDCSYNLAQTTFNVLDEKTLQSKKQKTKIDTFFYTVISLWRWLISFEYIKLLKNNFFSSSNPFEKFGFNKPSLYWTEFLGSLRQFVKTRVYCNPISSLLYNFANCKSFHGMEDPVHQFRRNSSCRSKYICC